MIRKVNSYFLNLSLENLISVFFILEYIRIFEFLQIAKMDLYDSSKCWKCVFLIARKISIEAFNIFSRNRHKFMDHIYI